MNSTKLITEVGFPVTVLAPDADRWNADPASDIVNLKNYEGVTFLIAEGAGGTGTAKIQVEECSDVSGTGNTAIAFRYQTQTTLGTQGDLTDGAAAGVTPAAGANKLTAVHVRRDDLSAGKPFVRVKMTEVVDDPCDAAIIAVLWGARFAQETPPDPLS